MKKLLNYLGVLILIISISGCGSSQKVSDGKYQAFSTESLNGWSHFITFDAKDGKIKNFKYDAVNLYDGIRDTKAHKSKNGTFPLSEGNSGEWYKQAQLIDNYVNKNQGTKDITFDRKGTSDAISGATIKYSEIPDLISKAKKNGSIKSGDLVNGLYYAQADVKDARGFTHFISFFVKDGVIIAAHIDAYQIIEENGKKVKQYKSALSLENKYDLGKDSLDTYDKQAGIISDYIIKNQGFKPKMDDSGRTDSISGASIIISEWVTLFDKALENKQNEVEKENSRILSEKKIDKKNRDNQQKNKENDSFNNNNITQEPGSFDSQKENDKLFEHQNVDENQYPKYQ